MKSGPLFTLSKNKPYEFDLTCTPEMVPSLVVLAWSILPLDELDSQTSEYVAAASIETKVNEKQTQVIIRKLFIYFKLISCEWNLSFLKRVE